MQLKSSEICMQLENYYRNKDILVTGGCGSIGSALVRKLTEFDVKRIRIFDNDEFGLFKLDSELGDTNKIRILVGDVRDENDWGWQYGMLTLYIT